MFGKQSEFKKAQELAEAAVNKTNDLIDILGEKTNDLYLALTEIQTIFDAIRNVPREKKLEYEELKRIRVEWKQQAEKIEKDYNNAKIKAAGKGAAGVSTGVAVASMGPTAAMGIATTFGVASTGTAISSLSGAAATNAALAWLGGGALAAGGGGMAAGEALLALAGPVGWAISGVALLSSGLLLYKNKKEQKQLERIFTLISKRDVKTYELAMVELNERISRISNESGLISEACERIRGFNTRSLWGFGINYKKLSEAQQYELGSYVNLMKASTQLLVNPVLSLQPKYSATDFERFLENTDNSAFGNETEGEKTLIINLANLLYKIDVDDDDQKKLWKSFRRNKKYLRSINVKKRDFKYLVMEKVSAVLSEKYHESNGTQQI